MSLRRSLLQTSLSALLAASLLGAPASAKQPLKTASLDLTAAIQELVFLPPTLAQTSPESRCNEISAGTGRTSGTGTAQRLGRFTLSASDCILPGSAPLLSFSRGQLVLTAANGDTINATYDGTLTPLPNPQGLPLYMIDGRLVYQGGTGRFAGAQGSGYLGGMLDLATGQGQLSIKSALSH